MCDYDNLEEEYTIGLIKNPNNNPLTVFTENRIRAEHGQRRRLSHNIGPKILDV